MLIHLDHDAAWGSLLSALLSTLFGVPAAVVLLAFSGSLAALSIIETSKGFFGACAFVAVSTTLGSVGAAGVTYVLPGFPERLSAFILGVMALPLIRSMIKFANGWPDRVKEKRPWWW